MARKQDFDPLGGFSGSGSRKSIRKDKKSYDVLGAGKYGDSGSIYDEGSYDPAPVTEYSDALLTTGYEEPQVQKKQKIPGFFSALFKKREKHDAQKADAAASAGAGAAAAAESSFARFDEEEQVPKYHHSSVSDISFNDGIMETGIIRRYDERTDASLYNDEPAPKTYHSAKTAAEANESVQSSRRPERFDENGYQRPYEEEVPVHSPARDEFPLAGDEISPVKSSRTDVRSDDIPMRHQAENPQANSVPQSVDTDLFSVETHAPIQNTDDDLFTDTGKKEEAKISENPSVPAPAALNHNICHLCGNVSKEDLPEFGFDNDDFVPLCKTCTRAVSTLLKHTDPYEEEEIYSEWLILCPSLDKKRAKELVRKGRSSL